jgi:hypothetical protein
MLFGDGKRNEAPGTNANRRFRTKGFEPKVRRDMAPAFQSKTRLFIAGMFYGEVG